MKTAEEYLKWLQLKEATYPLDSHKHLTIDKILGEKPDIKHMIDSLPEEERVKVLDDFIQWSNNPYLAFEDTLKSLRSSILAVIEPSDQSSLSNIPIGSLHTYDFNGWTIQAPDLRPVIVLHHGLMGFSHDMSRIIAANCYLADAPNDVKSYEKDYLVFKAAMSCMQFISDGKFRENHYVLLSSSQNRAAIPIRESLELFILAHEFGHCNLGHHNDIILRRGPEQEGINYYKRSWEAELEADKWASNILFKIGSTKAISPRFAYAAPSMVFSIMLFLEHVSEHFNQIRKKTSDSAALNFTPESTHPPTVSRRQAVEKLLDVAPQESLEFATFVKDLFDDLTKRIDRIFYEGIKQE